jgi:hypothetical protein
MRSHLLLASVALVVPLAACVVNNNNSPGATGVIAPTASFDSQVGVAMPGGSAQVNRAPTASQPQPYPPPPRGYYYR